MKERLEREQEKAINKPQIYKKEADGVVFEFQQINLENKVPDGWKKMTVEEAEKQVKFIQSKLHKWAIVLLDGGRIDGIGYGKHGDPHPTMDKETISAIHRGSFSRPSLYGKQIIAKRPQKEAQKEAQKIYNCLYAKRPQKEAQKDARKIYNFLFYSRSSKSSAKDSICQTVELNAEEDKIIIEKHSEESEKAKDLFNYYPNVKDAQNKNLEAHKNFSTDLAEPIGIKSQ